MFLRRAFKGFTLVEVMVALTIVAFSLTAIAASMNQMIDAANAMRERTYASWIAQNKIAEMRLANVQPEVTETTGDVTYANSEWTWRAVVSESGIEDFYRLEVSVFHAGSDYEIRTVTGFIGEPGAAGRSAEIWSRGVRSSGATN
ncbi:MAG: type II secretion system minor pseudopilin GspI [Gammaproteobacteria bacterium]|nr:type II secretion system minor pseudopilin GspI [Gammaproteobacteria bacterium]